MYDTEVGMVPAPVLKSRTPPDSIVRKLSEMERSVAALLNQNRQLAGEIDVLSGQIQKLTDSLAKQAAAVPSPEGLRATVEALVADLGESLAQHQTPAPERLVSYEPAFSPEDLRAAVGRALEEQLAPARAAADNAIDSLKLQVQAQIEGIRALVSETNSEASSAVHLRLDKISRSFEEQKSSWLTEATARANTVVSSYVDSKVQEVSGDAREYADVVSRQAIVAAKECIRERLNNEGLSSLKVYVQGELEGLKAYVDEAMVGAANKVALAIQSLDEAKRSWLTEATAGAVATVMPGLDSMSKQVLSDARDYADEAARKAITAATERIGEELSSRGLNGLKGQIQGELDSIRAYLSQANATATDRVAVALESLDEARVGLMTDAAAQAVTAVRECLESESRKISTEAKEHASLVSRDAIAAAGETMREALLSEVRSLVAARMSEFTNSARAYTDQRAEHTLTLAMAHAERSAGSGAGVSPVADTRIWSDMKEYVDYRINDVLRQVKPPPARVDLTDPFTGFGRKL